MSTYKDWVSEKCLSKKRGDTNSLVFLMKNKLTGELMIQKVVYGIDQPIYRAVFTREVKALYKLNNCKNIVKVLGHNNNMVVNMTNQKAGVIFLEYIHGQELSKMQIGDTTPKEKFSIIYQLISAIEYSHNNDIIHRDINPNNILIDDDNNVKLIDFGICKIKDMLNSATVYRLATNAYSAPEVNQHSENATEKSDLYSLGAVIYYLFTGKRPPLPSEFQDAIEYVSGIDIALKPILKKMVEENPKDRYENVSEVKNALMNLFVRFLDLNKTIVLTADVEKIKRLKYLRLIPNTASIREITNNYFPSNFLDLYVFVNGSNINDYTYIFLGSIFIAECVFDIRQNVFNVIEFKKVKPVDRERLIKKATRVEGQIKLVDKKYIQYELCNDSNEVRNTIIDYYNEFNSKRNVNYEFRNKYGVWRELLEIVKKDIEDNVVRYPYISYEVNEGIIKFILREGIFVDEGRLDKEQVFVYEKLNKKNNKVNIMVVGTYENDSYINNHLVLGIRQQGLVNLPKTGEICIDYRKEKINVERQLQALNTMDKEDYSCQRNLKRIVSGIDEPAVQTISRTLKMFNQKLDLSQTTAVKKALESEPISIIQGPPGTGKTNVIVEVILQIILDNKINHDIGIKKILIVSQSHTAVDKMLEDLVEATGGRVALLRIGRDEKLAEEIRKTYSINDVKEKWCEEVRNRCKIYSDKLLNEIGITNKDFDDYYSALEQHSLKDTCMISESIGSISKIENKAINTRLKKVLRILEIQKQWTNQLMRCDEAELYIIKSSEVIAGTCTGFASNKVIRDVDFEYVIVDEAAKATFPELAVPLNRAQHIILVGDHKQLPPVLDTQLIKDNREKIDEEKLKKGLFERLYEMFSDANKQKLTVQYRMHPVIGSLISQVFYDNEIQNGVEAKDRELNIEGYQNIAIQWISTSNCSEQERREVVFQNNDKKSYQNFLEQRIIREKLLELDKKINKKIQVGIITAYSSQKYILQTMVQQHAFKNLIISIDTVDAFQGSQKEIIIYSTVRSNNLRYGIGFLKSEARLNVAFSRAKCLLIIVGDITFLNNHSVKGNKFPEIIKYIKETEGCNIIKYGGK